MSNVFEHLDGAMQRLVCVRDELLANTAAPDRAARRAAAERAGVPVQSWAAGRVGAPRPVALSTTSNGR